MLLLTVACWRGEGDIDEEEELEVGSTASSQKASTSECQGTSRAFKRAKGTSTSKMEDALLSFLHRPRTSETLAMKVGNTSNTFYMSVARRDVL